MNDFFLTPFLGSFGVYAAVDCKNRSEFEFYSKLGFIEINTQNPGKEKTNQIIYLGRSF